MKDTYDIGRSVPWCLTGRHVLTVFICFFGVVFAVNGYFLVRALSTHSGVVAVEPYRKGLAYNERIAAGERQINLGWQDNITLGVDGTVTVAITEIGGVPLIGLHVTGMILRPSTAAADTTLHFGQFGPGDYVAKGPAMAPGTWIVAIEVRRSPNDADPIYRARRRLWLKP